MNKNPILRDVYYGYNINMSDTPKTIQERGDIFEFYEKAKITSYLDENRLNIIHPYSGYYNTMVAKSAAIQNLTEGIRHIKSMPPKGPIRDLCQCPACGEIGPRFHAEDCPGPYDNEVFTIDGIEFYIDKIKTSPDAISTLKSTNQLFYRDLFPERGIQKLKSDRLKIAFFPNVVQFKWATSPIVNNKYFGNNFPEGMMITIKVSPTRGINITHIPYQHSETEPTTFLKTIDEHILKSVLNENIDISDVSYISHIDGIYTITENNNILDIDCISRKIVALGPSIGMFGYNFSTYGSSVIFSFPFKIKTATGTATVKVTVNIKLTSVHIFVSFGSSKESTNYDISFIGHSTKATGKYLDISVLENIKTILNSKIFNDPECYVQKTIKRYINEDGKIYNVSIPYHITKDGKFEYLPKIKTGSAPPQPDKCRNKINGMATLKQSYIKRPYPFSFSIGEVPYAGVTLRDEGVTTTAVKFLGNRTVLYEPCCDTITGKDYVKPKNSKNDIDRIIISKESNFISSSDLMEMKKNLSITDNITKEKFEADIRQVIALMDSTKATMLRRAMFGFPNDIFPEDSALLHKIEPGIEIAPILKENEEYSSKQLSKKDTREINQMDIHSGVYIPGTQLKNYGGNNTLIRDHRQYYGLFKYLNDKSKDGLLNVIKLYFDKNIIENPDRRALKPIPITDEIFHKGIDFSDWYYIVVPKQSTSRVLEMKTNNNKKMEYNVFQHNNIIAVVDIIDDTLTFPERLFDNIPETNVILPVMFDKSTFKDIASKMDIDSKLIIIEPSYVYKDTKIYQWYFDISDDYVKNAVFHFRVGTSVKNDELVQLFLPVTENSEYIPINTPDRNILDMFQFEGKDYMFIQKTIRKNLVNNSIYRFSFNRYNENGKWKLVPNQPFTLISNQLTIGRTKVYEAVKNSDSNEYTLQTLNVALNAIDLDNLD
jgi:hypothetical protein